MARLSLLLLTVASLFPMSAGLAQPLDSPYADRHWSTRFGGPSLGHVQGMSAHGQTVFIAGSFRFGGGRTPGILRWNNSAKTLEVIGQTRMLSSGDSRGRVGPVLATADAVFVGGYFDVGKGPTRVAAWDRGAETWTMMNEGIDHRVVEFARTPGGQLYALTRYIIDRTAPWYGQVYRWTGDSWAPLGSSFEAFPTAITAGTTGVFISVKPGAGSCCHEVRRWTGGTWSSIGRGRNEGHVVGTIETLAISQEGMLYAGGHFTAMDDRSAVNIARWDGKRWHSLGKGLGPAEDATVYDIVTAGGGVYAAGRIERAGEATVNNIARWDGSAWSAVSGGANGPVYHVASAEDKLFAGGSFDVAGQTVAHDIAAWSEESGTWTSLYEAVGQGIRGVVTAVDSRAGRSFIAAGMFAAAGDTKANNVALWNGRSWSRLGKGVEGNIAAVAAGEDEVYVGGRLSPSGDTLSYGLAIWSGDETGWKYVGKDPEGQKLVRARSLVLTDDILYAAGKLQVEGDRTVVGLFRWNGQKWSVLGEVTHANSTRKATRVAVDPEGNLYLGGRFTKVDNIAAQSIARWDGQRWAPLGEGLSQTVSALEAASGYVYAAAGRHIGRQATGDVLHIWDKTKGRWAATESGLEPPDDCQLTISSIVAGSENVYVGGGPTVCPEGGQPEEGGRSLARWDGREWTTLGSGIQGRVYDLALAGSDLYVGGSFDRAGGHSSLNVARWNAARILQEPSPDHRETFILHRNYPNPFNATTTIQYRLLQHVDVTLSIYDLTGRKVATLVDQPQSRGLYSVSFDGSNLPSGLYIYHLETAAETLSKTMLLVK